MPTGPQVDSDEDTPKKGRHGNPLLLPGKGGTRGPAPARALWGGGVRGSPRHLPATFASVFGRQASSRQEPPSACAVYVMQTPFHVLLEKMRENMFSDFVFFFSIDSSWPPHSRILCLKNMCFRGATVPSGPSEDGHSESATPVEDKLSLRRATRCPHRGTDGILADD